MSKMKYGLLFFSLVLFSGCLEVFEGDSSVNLSKPAVNKIVASDGTASAEFGKTVKISRGGNYIAVGAPSATVGWDTTQGEAYLYKWDVIQGWVEIKKFVSLDGVSGDDFGCSVAVSDDGNTFVAGAYGADTGSLNATGAVYVYRWDGVQWKETKLIASDKAATDILGNSVDISADGETIAAGSYQNTSSAGAVYVFRWNGSGWTEYKLIASDGLSGDYFGSDVSVSDNGCTIAIAAVFDDVGANNQQGSVYVFKWNGAGYSEQKKLNSSDGSSGDNFGNEVAVSGDGSIVAVGTSQKAYGVSYSMGCVYTYRYIAWGIWNEAVIRPADPAEYDSFGSGVSVSQDGQWILASATGKNNYQGAAYLFQRTGLTNWTQVSKITASDAENSDYFGSDVSISSDGKDAVIGMSGDDISGAGDQGSIYFYHW